MVMSVPASADALDLWRAVIVEAVRDERPDLTARQLAVLMTVYLTAGPHTVRGLAIQLNVGKPAITRALDALTKFGLARRLRDQNDQRNVLVMRTISGEEYLEAWCDRIERCATDLRLVA